MNLGTFEKRLLICLFLFSIFWGIGYTEYTRYPLYFYTSFAIIFLEVRFIKIEYKYIVNLIIFLLYNYFISNYIESYIYPIFVILYVIFLSKSIEILIKKSDINVYYTLLKILFYAEIILSFNLLFQYFFSPEVFISGSYPEPSHLGYSFGPIFSLLLTASRQISARIITLISLLICSFVSPSATLFISFLIGLIVFNIHLISFRMKLFFSILLMIILLINLQVISIALGDWKGASYSIWLSGLIRGFEYFGLYPFGVGVFGWVGNEEIPIVNLGDNHDLMNQRDLASLLPFILSSYGFFGILGIIYLLFYLYKYDDESLIDSYLSKLLIVYSIIFFFRWAGPTLSPFLPLFSILIAIRKSNEKNIQNNTKYI